MENKTFKPLTTDEILERAYHKEPEEIPDELDINMDGLFPEENYVMTDDEAEAYAQGFVTCYGGDN